MMPTVIPEQAPVPPPAYRCTHVGPHVASADTLSAGSTPSTSPLCTAIACWSRWCATYLQRSVLTAHRPLTHLVATLLPRHARLVSGLAHVSAGLWLATGSHREASHSQSVPTMQAGCSRWRTRLRGALCAERPHCHAPTADGRTRSAYRQCAHPGMATCRPRCRHRPCACSASTSPLTRLASAYLALSWLRLAHLFSPLPRQCP
jgi:hypothetical protein